MVDVIVAVISALVTICTVIITSKTQANTVDAKLDKAQAITETKLDALTREVREHNHFAQRMPVVEEQIKEIKHRLEILEREGKE